MEFFLFVVGHRYVFSVLSKFVFHKKWLTRVYTKEYGSTHSYSLSTTPESCGTPTTPSKARSAACRVLLMMPNRSAVVAFALWSVLMPVPIDIDSCLIIVDFPTPPAPKMTIAGRMCFENTPVGLFSSKSTLAQLPSLHSLEIAVFSAMAAPAQAGGPPLSWPVAGVASCFETPPPIVCPCFAVVSCEILISSGCGEISVSSSKPVGLPVDVI